MSLVLMSVKNAVVKLLNRPSKFSCAKALPTPGWMMWPPNPG